MSDNNDNGSSRRRTTIIVVGIVSGIILVFLLCCGAPVYLAFRETAQSQRVANEFLENIRADRLDLAYESATARFKQENTRQAFDELIRKNPELKDPDLVPLNEYRIPPAQVFSGPYNYWYLVQAKDGKSHFEFQISVAKENGVLKVQALILDKKKRTK